MILTRCDRLQKLLARLKQADEEQKQAATLELPRAELLGWVAKLHEISGRARVLREAKVVGKISALPAAKMSGLKVALVAVRTNLATNPFSVTKGKDYRTVTTHLDKLHEKMQGQLMQAWGAWTDRSTARIDDGELSRYEGMPVHAAAVKEIRDGRALVTELPNELPETREDFAEADRLLERLRSLIASLPRTDNPEVRRFLDAANGPKGAGLELVTEAVIEYLNKTGMYGNYRIHIR